VVDAAALAGAQALPFDPRQAVSDARSYASANSSAVTLSAPVISQRNSTIDIRASQRLPGIFSSLAGIAGVTAGARAVARVGPAGLLSNDALVKTGDAVITPVVIDDTSACTRSGCIGPGAQQTFVLDDDLGLMCPSDCSNGRDGRDTMAAWIEDCPSRPSECLQGSFGTGGTVDVDAASSQVTCSNEVADALDSLPGRTLIVPLVDSVDDSPYRIVGFAALVVTDVGWATDNGNGKDNGKGDGNGKGNCNGNGNGKGNGKDKGDDNRWIRGYFTTYRAPGGLSTDVSAVDYGVDVIGLTT
jgi:hypothetical protein